MDVVLASLLAGITVYIYIASEVAEHSKARRIRLRAASVKHVHILSNSKIDLAIAAVLNG